MKKQKHKIKPPRKEVLNDLQQQILKTVGWFMGIIDVPCSAAYCVHPNSNCNTCSGHDCMWFYTKAMKPIRNNKGDMRYDPMSIFAAGAIAISVREQIFVWTPEIRISIPDMKIVSPDYATVQDTHLAPVVLSPVNMDSFNVVKIVEAAKKSLPELRERLIKIVSRYSEQVIEYMDSRTSSGYQVMNIQKLLDKKAIEKHAGRFALKNLGL